MKLEERIALEKVYEILRESWIAGATQNNPDAVQKAQEMLCSIIIDSKYERRYGINDIHSQL